MRSPSRQRRRAQPRSWPASPPSSGARRGGSPREPLSIYEVHLGSWRRVPEEGDRFLDYRELADQLADYVGEMGFTHVELLPVMEHPFYGSWGYRPRDHIPPERT